jgi:hypothetical protein
VLEKIIAKGMIELPRKQEWHRLHVTLLEPLK